MAEEVLEDEFVDPLRLGSDITNGVWDQINDVLTQWLQRVSYLKYLSRWVKRLKESFGFSREEISNYCQGIVLQDSVKQDIADNFYIWLIDRDGNDLVNSSGETLSENEKDSIRSEYEVLFWCWDTASYTSELQSRIAFSENVPWKYNSYLSELIQQWKIHNYMYVGEGGHGKAIIVFDYFTDFPQLSIIKLSKHKTETIEVVWNFVEEASVQWAVSDAMENADHDLALKKAITSERVELKVPKIYKKNGRREGNEIFSEPEQWILSMEYTNGETIESLLWLADYYDSHFKHIKSILAKHIHHPYIWKEVMQKLELHGYDFRGNEIDCPTSHIIRLLTKKDITEILIAEWINIRESGVKWEEYIPAKQHKHGVDYSSTWDFARTIKVFLKMHGSELGIDIKNEMEIHSIAKEALETLWAWKSDIWGRATQHPFKSGTISLKHRDLNGSNIMIDFDRKTKKLLIWIIDYGATEDSQASKIGKKSK